MDTGQPPTPAPTPTPRAPRPKKSKSSAGGGGASGGFSTSSPGTKLLKTSSGAQEPAPSSAAAAAPAQDETWTQIARQLESLGTTVKVGPGALPAPAKKLKKSKAKSPLPPGGPVRDQAKATPRPPPKLSKKSKSSTNSKTQMAPAPAAPSIMTGTSGNSNIDITIAQVAAGTAGLSMTPVEITPSPVIQKQSGTAEPPGAPIPKVTTSIEETIARVAARVSMSSMSPATPVEIPITPAPVIQKQSGAAKPPWSAGALIPRVTSNVDATIARVAARVSMSSMSPPTPVVQKQGGTSKPGSAPQTSTPKALGGGTKKSAQTGRQHNETGANGLKTQFTIFIDGNIAPTYLPFTPAASIALRAKQHKKSKTPVRDQATPSKDVITKKYESPTETRMAGTTAPTPTTPSIVAGTVSVGISKLEASIAQVAAGFSMASLSPPSPVEIPNGTSEAGSAEPSTSKTSGGTKKSAQTGPPHKKIGTGANAQADIPIQVAAANPEPQPTSVIEENVAPGLAVPIALPAKKLKKSKFKYLVRKKATQSMGGKKIPMVETKKREYKTFSGTSTMGTVASGSSMPSMSPAPNGTCKSGSAGAPTPKTSSGRRRGTKKRAPSPAKTGHSHKKIGSGVTGTPGKPPPKTKGPTLRVINGMVKYSSEPKEKFKYKGIDPSTIVYDPTVPFECRFCTLGEHDEGMGTLYGPYYTDEEDGGKRETWLHAACVLWTFEILPVGIPPHLTLRNLTSAVKNGAGIKCTICKRPGPTVKCRGLKEEANGTAVGCPRIVHVPCGKINGWRFNLKNFRTYCQSHGSQDPDELPDFHPWLTRLLLDEK